MLSSKSAVASTNALPGLMKRPSLIASPYRSARAALVNTETFWGASRGTGFLATVNQAIATPIATVTSTMTV